MAILSSEDQEWGSSLEIKGGDEQELLGQRWQRFTLHLSSGDHRLALGNSDSQAERDACMFCRTPNDEIAELVSQLQDFAKHKKDRVLFEPAEPSFELEVVRAGTDGINVHVWLDAGNAKTGVYRWDAAGIRFFTVQSNLLTFVEQLKEQFAC